jgi:hypothetical protein
MFDQVNIFEIRQYFHYTPKTISIKTECLTNTHKYQQTSSISSVILIPRP